MNAPFSTPYRIPTDNEPGPEEAPEWNNSPSRCDWQVMVWGGSNPRTGFPQQPLEFAFFGKFYSRRDIHAKAADMAEREHRAFWQVREPTDLRFMRGRAA